MFGSDTPTLQKLALRLVSQCCSSSGCECNWSTFALVHTKVRNRLSHKKLHKLVYVNYNLRLRLKDAIGFTSVQGEDDPFSQLMELSLYDTNNPIRQWMEMGRSNADPLLDEEDTESDPPLPSSIVAQGTSKDNLVKWTKKNVGDTHVGKRKARFVLRKNKQERKDSGG